MVLKRIFTSCLVCMGTLRASVDGPCPEFIACENLGHKLHWSGEYLYWYSRESHLPIGVEAKSVPAIVSPPERMNIQTNVKKAINLKTHWDPGLRLGFGVEFDTGGDLSFEWTQYNSSSSRTLRGDDFRGLLPDIGQVGFINPWGNVVFDALEEPFYTTIKSAWHMRFTQLEARIGTRCPCWKSLSLYPFVGARGAKVSTRFVANGEPKAQFIDTDFLGIRGSKNRFKNEFWGGGVFAGFSPRWYLGDSWSFFTLGDVALVYGQHSIRKSARVLASPGITPDQQIDTSFTTRKSCFRAIQPVLDVGVGLSIDSCIKEEQYRINFDVAWEHHIWLSLNHRYIQTVTQMGVDANEICGFGSFMYKETRHDLSFGGLVVRGCFAY